MECLKRKKVVVTRSQQVSQEIYYCQCTVISIYQAIIYYPDSIATNALQNQLLIMYRWLINNKDRQISFEGFTSEDAFRRWNTMYQEALVCERVIRWLITVRVKRDGFWHKHVTSNKENKRIKKTAKNNRRNANLPEKMLDENITRR